MSRRNCAAPPQEPPQLTIETAQITTAHLQRLTVAQPDLSAPILMQLEVQARLSTLGAHEADDVAALCPGDLKARG